MAEAPCATQNLPSGARLWARLGAHCEPSPLRWDDVDGEGDGLHSAPMIRSVQLRYGPSADAPPLHFEPGRLTLFVGPNNVGKSLMLRELLLALNDPLGDGRHIVADVTPVPLDAERTLALIGGRTVSKGPGYVMVSGRGKSAWQLEQRGTDISQTSLPHFLNVMLGKYSLSLDGSLRLSLGDPQTWSAIAPEPGPQPHWSALFRNQDLQARASADIFAAFDRHLAVDGVTQLGKLVPRLSESPVPQEHARSMTEEAVGWFEKAPPLSAFSDGVKAYCGILAVLHGGDDRIVCVDEPDAFLHPPLARTLGRQMAELAASRDGHVFAATHSAAFVLGAVSTKVPVTVVRLDRNGTRPTARCLDPQALSAIMQNPMLRATGVVESLFYRNVVVCEGHSDRVFYGAVNDDLAAERQGAPDCHFLDAGSWQSVRRLLAPLRRLGIPTSAIVDLDVAGQPEFSALMDAAGVTRAEADGIRAILTAHLPTLRATGVSLKRGLHAVPGDAREQLKQVLDQLALHGLFLVPVGELEGWLPGVGSQSKSEWTDRAISKLAGEPTGAMSTAVRDFVVRMAGWLEKQR